MTTTPSISPAARRIALAFALLLVLLAATLVFSPAARAFGQTVLRQIGMIAFTNETRPEPDQITLPTPGATGTPVVLLQPRDASELERVTAQAGFEPLLPAYVPDGYQQDGLVAMEYIGDAAEHVAWGTSARYVTADGLHYLDVQQALFDTMREFPIGDNPVVDVTVRGREGVWLEQVVVVPEETVQPPFNSASFLLWDEDGYTIAILTDSLPLEEVLKVAESLGQ